MNSQNIEIFDLTEGKSKTMKERYQLWQTLDGRNFQHLREFQVMMYLPEFGVTL